VDAFLEGKKPRAYELINNALLLSPDFAYSHYTLGYFYYNDNKYDEAIVELKKTIEQTNTFWPAYKLLGDIYFTKNDYADAVEQYKFALNLNFNDAVLNNDLGLALMELERYKEAAEYLKQAAKLDQGDINVRYNLASVLRDLGSYAESAEMFKEVLHLWPDYPGVLADLGDIYKIQGDITEAKSYYDKQVKSAKAQLAKNPNDHVALNNLARAYNGLKKYDDAKELIKKCLALKPDYRDGYLTLAAIQQSMEEYNAALVTLNKAKSMSRSAGFIDRGIMGIKNTIKKFVTIDKVYLKNGRILEGNIKEESDDKLVMELFSGGSRGEITLSSGDIQRIVHAGDPED
jgi:tetratricopeptide (TPR) repeat protein